MATDLPESWYTFSRMLVVLRGEYAGSWAAFSRSSRMSARISVAVASQLMSMLVILACSRPAMVRRVW